jgi:Rv2525c-like, glycoside hydrolase-like domain
VKRAVQRVAGHRKSKAALVAVALVAAALLSACLPAAPPPPPPAYTKGFDACAAPSLTTMSKWKASSPYTSIGVYIGGANRGCAQPNLTSTWVSSVWAQGWKLLPIWVGPQASCTTLGSTTKLSSDGFTAFLQGINEAQAAADAAQKLGLGWLASIYYDMEGYARGGACSASVQGFADGWVRQLNARGYLAGMYSSLCSGILDAAATVNDTTKKPLNAVWIAAWNNSPSIYGFGSPCALSDSVWNNHQRVHQYSGGHNESYGGITVNIDSNAVDGPTG